MSDEVADETAKYTPPPGTEMVQTRNVNKRVLSEYENSPTAVKARNAGIAGGKSKLDIQPLFRQTPSEKILSNGRNAWIVLGVDRPSTSTSGYGGRGATQCAAIDIVAGRMGAYVRDTDNDGNVVYSNPDFTVDAARVYISQKSDIDEYFKIVDGKVGNTLAGSAVALKADEIRLVARGGIKLVTKTDVRNSLGQKQIETLGIDLIAGNNDEDLQPMVKGDNLVMALSKFADAAVADLREILASFITYQNNINGALLSHTHISPFYGLNSSPSFTSMPQIASNLIKSNAQSFASIPMCATNVALWETTYLSPASSKYICSKNNNTN